MLTRDTRGPALPPRYERAAASALEQLREAPPLALLAVCAALFELAMARVGWHGLTDLADADTVRQLGRLARFPRNLAAVGGSIALLVALLQYLRFPGFASIGRRLAVAAFAGIFLPCIAVATFLPHESLRPRLVLFGLAAADVLVALISLSALRYRAEVGLRIAVAGVAISTFLILVVLGVSQLSQADQGPWAWFAALVARHPTTTQTIHLGLRHAAEVVWHAVLFAGAWTTIVGDFGERNRTRILAGASLFGALLGGLLGAGALVGHRFPLLVFGSFRWMLALDAAPLLYTIPVAAALAGGFVGLARTRPEARQVGIATLFWLCAGFGPHTPIQLLYLVIGGALFVRSAQAYDPTGAWRLHHPWMRLSERRARG
ncbi:MAG: hypothetical protein AB7S26_40625 [Sandaracinaceae bacterium]